MGANCGQSRDLKIGDCDRARDFGYMYFIGHRSQEGDLVRLLRYTTRGEENMQGDGVELIVIIFKPHVRFVRGIAKRTKPEIRPIERSCFVRTFHLYIYRN